MRQLIKFLQSYFLHSWTLSPPFYINHRKKNLSSTQSYFRLVINVHEKRASFLNKIIARNYIHNSSLWQIPSTCPVVLYVWTGFIPIPLILMNKINNAKYQKKKKKAKWTWQRRAAVGRLAVRALVHNLVKESNLKFFNRSSYQWAVGAVIPIMNYWMSFFYIKRSTYNHCSLLHYSYMCYSKSSMLTHLTDHRDRLLLLLHLKQFQKSKLIYILLWFDLLFCIIAHLNAYVQRFLVNKLSHETPNRL